jgi:phytoene synthase
MQKQDLTKHYIAHQVKIHDYDRYLCNLFTDSATRDRLNIICLFNIELFNTLVNTNEEITTLIRLQWFREAIEGIFQGKIRNSPVIEQIALITQEFNFKLEDFESLICVYEILATPEPFYDIDELLSFIDNFMGAFINLYLKCFKEDDMILKNNDYHKLLRFIGILEWLIISSKINRLQAKIFPLSLMQKYNFNNNQIHSNDNILAIRQIIKELLDLASENYKFLHQNKFKIPLEIMPLYMNYLVGVDRLKKITKHNYQIFSFITFNVSKTSLMLKMLVKVITKKLYC